MVPAPRFADAREALDQTALRSVPDERWREYLSARRWFGAKGRSIRAITVDAVVPVTWPGDPTSRYAIVVLRLDLAGGGALRYQLPLGVVPAQEVDRSQVLVSVELGGAAPHAIVDATLIPSFRSGFGAAFQNGAAFEHQGWRWRVEAVGAGVALPDKSTVGAAEQSNTSLIFGREAICKLFRRLEHGDNPDVELGRFLTTRTSFRNIPALLGIAMLDEPGGRSVSAMLTRYLPGSRDAWTHALERIAAYLEATGNAEPPNPFAAEARQLGAVTRAMHEALASAADDPAFAPTPATDADVRSWRDAALVRLDDAMSLLERKVNALEGQTQAHGRALVHRRSALEDRVRSIGEEVLSLKTAGLKIRHHGDFHLGQVLRTTAGEWMIIDFEGEPARPLEERRARHSPLRDVAGMMRSFAYAAAAGAMQTGGIGRNAQVEIRSARWERDAREHFLGGYLGARDAGSAALLPATPAGTTSLLALFEAEKLFYELGYELDNRPTWAWIPLRGIAKLL